MKSAGKNSAFCILLVLGIAATGINCARRPMKKAAAPAQDASAPADLGTPTDTETPDPIDLPSNQIETQELALDESSSEVSVTSELQIATPFISCSDGLLKSINAGANGYVLLSKSTAIIKRPSKHTDKDGITQHYSKPHKALKCQGDFSFEARFKKELSQFKTELLQKRKLKSGQSLIEAIKIAPEATKDTTAQLTQITCVQTAQEGVSTGNNGLILLTGSHVLLHRDTGFTFPEGSNKAGAQDYALISCETDYSSPQN